MVRRLTACCEDHCSFSKGKLVRFHAGFDKLQVRNSISLADTSSRESDLGSTIGEAWFHLIRFVCGIQRMKVYSFLDCLVCLALHSIGFSCRDKIETNLGWGVEFNTKQILIWVALNYKLVIWFRRRISHLPNRVRGRGPTWWAY